MRIACQIDNLLDLLTNAFILNASGWSITENVTVEKKYTLIEHMLIDEEITKRRKNLQAFCLGLQSLGINFLMAYLSRSNEGDIYSVMIHHLPLKYFSLISTTPSSPLSYVTAYNFLMEFISQIGGTCII